MNKNIKNILSLAVFVVFIIGMSALIGYVTKINIATWYNSLTKPAISPPNWVFAPVWNILYITIAVSGWLIYKKDKLNGSTVAVYALQLVLNFIWSLIFFYAQSISWALIEIIALWLVILLNIKIFYGHFRLAAYLLIPYFIWVSFATILNFLFWYQNVL